MQIYKPFKTPGDIYNATPPSIIFGPGTVSQVAAEAARLGARRALVVSTPGRSGLAQKVVSLLGDQCAGLLPEAVSQVPIELAIRARARARELGADCLVSVGGGASIGLGKGIALELAMPVIAVPTTYSGSEMTGFCGITIDGVKRMHTSLNMLARTVIYDPELSMSLPPQVSAASALNALAHCVDAVVVHTCSPITAMAAAQGAAAIFSSVPGVIRDPSDIQARTGALYGAYLSGAALTGGFALQTGVAHVLGGSFDVPHGLAHALMLPYVTAFYGVHVPALIEPIAAAVGVAPQELGAAIFRLMEALGLPTSLAAVGFNPELIDRAAQITVETDNGMTPVPVTTGVVQRLLQDAYQGRCP